ncbi:MAG: hypothetical protein AB7O66_06140 [Limisphaerales bacterium]
MRKSRLPSIVLALIASTGSLATEFGGGISGPDPLVDTVLSSLAGRPGFRWIRSPSQRVPAHGFEGVADVRLYQHLSDRPSDKLPEDLFETYWACRNRLPSFQGAPAVWEVWNEPDFYFIRDNASDMAATLKAAWWGVKTSRPDAKVLMPSLAFRPGRYALELAINGVASWTDGWNVHFYGWAADFPEFIAHHRAFTAALHLDAPLWITEIGYMDLPRTTDNDPVALGAQAAFHERTLIESWARGVDRHLIFQLSPFAEGRNELGLSTSTGTWRPAMTSAVRIARALQGTRPVFRIVHSPSDEDAGIVLEQADGNWWIVLWSPTRPGNVPLPGVGPESLVPDPIRLQPRWPATWREVRVGVEGETALAPSQVPELLVGSAANVHLHGPPVRFHLSHCRWVPWEKRASEQPRTKIPRETRKALDEVPPLRQPSPVVVRIRPDPSMIPEKQAQLLRIPPRATESSGRIQFHNFTDQPRRGTWSIRTAAHWNIEAGTTDRELDIPPLSRLEIPFRLLPEAGPANASSSSEPGRITARWEGLDGSVDESSVRVQIDHAPKRIRHTWDWRQFVASPGRADAWRTFVHSDDVLAVEIATPWGSNHEVAIHLPLPGGLHPDDVFGIGLRMARGRGSPFVQLQATTRHGETWRHGELRPIEAVESRIEARLRDFSPALWGRHRTLLFPPLAEMRWLSLLIQGVQPGDVLEVRSPSLVR